MRTCSCCRATTKILSGVTSSNRKGSADGAPFSVGRGDKIRTCDFYVPNVALYQAEPHLDYEIVFCEDNSSRGNSTRRYALFLLPLPPRASQRIARALRRLPLLSAPLIRPRHADPRNSLHSFRGTPMRRSRTSPSRATPRLHTLILYHLPPLLSSLFYKDFFSPRVFFSALRLTQPCNFGSVFCIFEGFLASFFFGFPVSVGKIRPIH